MIFQKEFFKKMILKKNQQTIKKHAKFPRRQRVEGFFKNNELYR